MPIVYKKASPIIKYIFLALSLLILLDSYTPGKEFESTIQSVSINYEPYFNAGGNGHDSYSIVTEDHSFYINEDEKDNFSKGNDISYRLSPIFKEVQQFESNDFKGSISSLRLYSGTLFPLFFIGVILLSFRLREKMSVLLFVTQVAIIADLIYLLYK